MIGVGKVCIDGLLVVKLVIVVFDIIVLIVVIDSECVWVLCGVYKLVGVLEVFVIVVVGWCCLDVGVLIGGFIEVLLDCGVVYVVVVDVGYG